MAKRWQMETTGKLPARVKKAGGGIIDVLRLLRTELPTRIAKPAIQRAERIGDESPNAADLFQPRDIADKLANPYYRMAIIKPEMFERAALPIGGLGKGQYDPFPTRVLPGSDRNTVNFLKRIVQSGEKLDEVPFLDVKGLNEKYGRGNLGAVLGHDGRHRNRALAAAGIEKSLVSFEGLEAPKAWGYLKFGPDELKELHDNLETARKSFSPGGKFIPEAKYSFGMGLPTERYDKVFASEPFADGGLVHLLRSLPRSERFEALTEKPLRSQGAEYPRVMTMPRANVSYYGGQKDPAMGGAADLHPDRWRWSMRDESARPIGEAAMHMENGLPKALFDIEIEKALRGQGYGRETIATLLSNMKSENDRFKLFDVQPKAKKIWEAMGSQMEDPSRPYVLTGGTKKGPRNNDYYLTPGDFLDTIGKADGGSVSPALGGLSRIAKLIAEYRNRSPEYATRLEKAADLVPRMESLYSDDALSRAVKQQLAVYDPSKFESLAANIYPYARKQDNITSGQQKNIEYLRSLIRSGQPFSDVPFLKIGENYIPEATRMFAERLGISPQREMFPSPRVLEHEGRHRSRAMAREGIDTALMGIDQANPLMDWERNIPQTNPVARGQMTFHDLDQTLVPQGDWRWSRRVPAREVFKSTPFKRGGLS